MQIDQQKGVAVSGLVPRKWMLYSNDDMTIIYKNHVISLSELDKFSESLEINFAAYAPFITL